MIVRVPVAMEAQHLVESDVENAQLRSRLEIQQNAELADVELALKHYGNKDKIILFTDSNEELHERGQFSIGEMATKLNLKSALEAVKVVPSTNKSHRVIDHMLYKGINSNNILKTAAITARVATNPSRLQDAHEDPKTAPADPQDCPR